MAGIIRTVLERACAQPPTVQACIALLAVYGGAILAAVIGEFVLFAP